MHFEKKKILNVLKNDKRDLTICERCGLPENMERHLIIHHKDRRKDKNLLFSPSNLLVLCEDCHKEIHRLKKKMKRSIQSDEETEKYILFIQEYFDPFNLSEFVRKKIKEFGEEIKEKQPKEAPR